MAAAPGHEAARALYMKRRIGRAPHRRGSLTGTTCPDIFELSDGNFAVIGTDRTDEFRHLLAAESEDTRVVVISRETLVYAKASIPDT